MFAPTAMLHNVMRGQRGDVRVLDKVEMLERLTALWKAGTLSAEEFQEQKRQLLAGLSTTVQEPGHSHDDRGNSAGLRHAFEQANPKRIGMFAGGAIAAVLALIAVFSLSPSNPSEGSGALAKSEVVPPNWKSKEDLMDGPRKHLMYWTKPTSGPGTLAFSCSNGNLNAYVTPAYLDKNCAFDTKATGRIRVDGGSAEQLRLVCAGGEPYFRPGSGQPNDAAAFMKRLRGANSLVFSLDEMMGIPITDAPVSFDITGSEVVLDRMLAVCR